MSTEDDRTAPVLATLTGRHHPDALAGVLGAVASTGARLVEVEQAVVGACAVVHLVVDPDRAPQGGAGVVAALETVGAEHGLDVSCATDPTTTPSTAKPGDAGGPGLHVTVLAQDLGAAALATVVHEVVAGGGTVERVRQLSRAPVAAVELDVAGADEETLRRSLARCSHETGVDVAVRRAGLARHGRRLVVLDVDSTLIRDEVIELIAARAGREEEVAALTGAAMRGEIDFAQSLRARVATLAGLPVSALAEVVADVRLTPGAATLVDVLHHLGWTVALVSGGFVEVVAPVAASLGITRVRANALEVRDGRLTGRTAGPVVDRAGKAQALRDLAAAEHLPLERTVAVGDGANDLDMLAAAGIGVAFNATPVVRAAARAAITTPRLDSVLHLLGISRTEIDEIASSR